MLTFRRALNYVFAAAKLLIQALAELPLPAAWLGRRAGKRKRGQLALPGESGRRRGLTWRAGPARWCAARSELHITPAGGRCEQLGRRPRAANTLCARKNKTQVLRCPDDGLDGSALPVLPPPLVAAGAPLYGDGDGGGGVAGRSHRLLAFSPAEHPVALQLAGCEPGALAAAWLARPSATTKSTSMSVARRAGTGRQVRRLPDG